MSNGIGDYTQTNYIDQLQYPTQTSNWMAAAGAALPSAVMGVDAMIKSRKAGKEMKRLQGSVDTLMQSYMAKPIVNPYANLPVATKAFEMQADQTDAALANTLDTIRATGGSAGGATALAQAAAKSKQQISGDIQKQEASNAQLEAKGEFLVQQAEMSRMGEQMDYEQSKADQARAEKFGYGERAATQFGQLANLGYQMSRGLSKPGEEEVVVEEKSGDGTTQDLGIFGGEGDTASYGTDPTPKMAQDPKGMGDPSFIDMSPEAPTMADPTSWLMEGSGYKSTGSEWGERNVGGPTLGELVFNRDKAKREGLSTDIYQAEIDKINAQYGN